jgi:ABC-type Fe3+/spermidine/putrescine transport system ATPase subunit
LNSDDSSNPAVELRGVSKHFGSRVILDHIDLSVAAGEVLVLVGASGSGKSTLLKIVAGIESPDEGKVFLGGADCTNVPPYRRPVHTVFQSYALFPHLNVFRNVEFPLAVAGRPKAERQGLVEQALGWVKLEQHVHRGVDSLSGGERQRVALARAIVDSPQCVLLDEPLSALDPHLRADTLALLQDVQSRLKMTFIFITHDRDEALRLGHRIGVLNQGRLEQVGPPEKLYREPATPFVASFLGKINWLNGELDGRPSTVRIAGRTIPCATPTGQLVGRVRVGLRPEDVRIDGDGWLMARVVSRQFLGDSEIITVALADGTTLIVDQRAPFGEATPGEQVAIGWQPDAAHLYPGDERETQP